MSMVGTEVRKRSQLTGKGVFAVRDFRESEMIVKLEGKVVDHPTQTSLQIGEEKHLEGVLHSWHNLNHGCNPNAYINHEDFTLRPLWPIQSGEEITFDYNSTEYDMCVPFECLCGEENCRKAIKGFKYLSSEEQKNTKSLVPYLQKRMDMQIKKSNPSDALSLTEIAKAAKGCWGYSKEQLQIWDQELTISPEDIEKGLVFHVEQEGKIIGFYSLSENEEAFEFEHLWIAPEYTGKGFRKMLFDHAKETALQNGGKKIRVESDPNAQGFYLKIGMHRIGEKESSIPDRMLPVFETTLEK